MLDKTRNEEIPQERITVYGRQDRYRLLKAKLAAKGIAVTEWFRQKLEEELALPY